jgi:hypothetical protein
MIYAYILEDNILCCTYQLEFVPEEYKENIFVFENLNIGEEWKLKIENNQVVLKSESEIESEINKKIANEKKEIIRQKIQKIENNILSKYTQSEIYSWSYKTQEAEKIINSNYNLNEIQIIYNELKTKLNKNPTSEELLNRANEILNRKNEFSILSGKIAGVRSFIDNAKDENLINLDVDNFISNIFGEIL